MRESSEEVYITLIDPHDGIEDPLEIRLLVYFTVEPDEYEGPYLFYRGGIVVNHIELYETFEFMGRLFEVSEEFPVELEKFVEWDNTSLEDHVVEIIADKLSPPKHRYPDSRSY